MPSDDSLQRQVLEMRHAGDATDAESEPNVGIADFDGDVESVTFTPDTVLTGVASNSRSLGLRNKGLAGTANVLVAFKDFVSGVNAAEEDETAITLSATPANLDVVAGDVLALESLAPGTGLACPAGLVRVVIRGDAG